MKQHKNGMVLLMVLVFMVISQLIFMGILHLNRINSLRYLTLTQFYQSQAEEILVRQQIDPILKEQNNQQLLKELDTNFANVIKAGMTFKRYSASSLPLSDNQLIQGWFEVTLTTGQTGILLYTCRLYLPPELAPLIDPLPPSFAGYLDPQRLPPLEENSVHNDLEQFKQQVLLDSYELADRFYFSRQFSFQPLPPPSLTFLFNTGEVQLEPHHQGYKLYFFSQDERLIRTVSKDLPYYPYVIKMHGELYQKKS